MVIWPWCFFAWKSMAFHGDKHENGKLPSKICLEKIQKDMRLMVIELLR